jgi:hypothetical protein
MTPDQVLRGKLRKIEALFAGAATPGEKAAAGAAAERIRERLGQAAGKENFIEWKFSIPDIWSRQLFIALCRRYGLCGATIWMRTPRRSGWPFWRLRRGDDCRGATITQAIFS